MFRAESEDLKPEFYKLLITLWMVNVFQLNFKSTYNDNSISTCNKEIELNSVCPITQKRESPPLYVFQTHITFPACLTEDPRFLQRSLEKI